MTASSSARRELQFIRKLANIGQSIATNKRQFLLQKKLKYFWAEFNKILKEAKVIRYGHFFKWSFRRAEKYAVKKKVLSFKNDGQKCKMVVKIEFTPLPHCKMFPFNKLKGFYNFF